MSKIEITISESKLEARISIAEEGEFPTIMEIREAIADAGVIYGVDESVLDTIVRDGHKVSNLLFARGRRPGPGIPATIEWHIDPDYSKRPAITEGDRADFKQLRLFEPVQKDQEIARKVSPAEGEPGIGVDGSRLVRMGEDTEFPAGKNTYVSEDGSKLFASIFGYAFFSQGQLNIDNIYRVEGDVDYNTGNVKFNGAVMIEGDVRSGFRVEATDSIFVGGNVEASTLYSKNGDVTVQYGILGQGKARVISGGNVNCGFVQDATIGAKGDVNIQRYSINSTISSWGKITLLSNEGLIRGGQLTADKGIEAVEVGSDQLIETELNISEFNIRQNEANMWDISKNRAALLLRLSSLQKRLAFIKLLKSGKEKLSQRKEEEYEFVQKEIERLKQKMAELDKTEVSLQKQVSREIVTKELIVTGTIHAKVQVNIAGASYYFDNPVSGVRLYKFRDEIVIESLETMEHSGYNIYVPKN